MLPAVGRAAPRRSIVRSLPPCSVPLPLRFQRRILDLTTVAASALALIIARPSNAAWQQDGVPLSPLPTLYQDLFLAELAADGSGGAYAVWKLREFVPQISDNR